MTASVREFYTELYEEHLEESSFLYEHRRQLLDDPEISWRDIGDFEDRLEAHLDALARGGEAARKVCARKAADGDFGELHAAARVFCLQNRPADFMRAVENMETGDENKFDALADALGFDMPPAWFPDLQRFLAKGTGVKKRLLARTVGFRRIPAPGVLADVFDEDDVMVLLTALWAAGRIRSKENATRVYKFLAHESPEVCLSAAMALLRMGEPFLSIEKATPGRNREALILPAGLSGFREKVPEIIEAVSCGKDPSAALALGSLGDIRAVEPLMETLFKPDLADAASVALQLITGAGLLQEIHIPEETDTEELFEWEKDESFPGETIPVDEKPGRIDTQTLLSRDAGQWRRWWEKNSGKFSPGKCYRNGRPCSPERLLENLSDANSPRIVREIAFEEMVLRYGLDLPFETDMPVERQVETLAKYERLVRG